MIENVNWADGCYSYEPKPVPKTDADGNIIGYDFPQVLPCTLAQSDDLRVKSFPNELGCTADSDNVSGFSATLDIINKHRNVKTSGLSPIGDDDCGMMSTVADAVNSISKKK